MESDLYLTNPNLIRKYEYRTNILGKYVDSTNDWCAKMDNDIITKYGIGGTNCYQICGITYINSDDGKKLSKDIEKVYNTTEGKKEYFSKVPLDIYKENYNLAIRNCKDGDIIEVDTFNELRDLDSSYNVS